ncbi:MAG: methylmalonyl-CoA mutase [Candidatus Rokubacteria bacterium]|nr:methylmalonyl-CoA mutase [Candidatus Rokubacteria bacterium]
MYDPEVLAAIAAAQADYERRVAEILGRAGGPEAPQRTQSGLPLRALYTPADVAGLDFAADLGFPGEFPYTRGVRPTGYQTKEWTRRQVVGIGTAEETNQRLRYLMKQGQTGFSVCGMGYANYDSDSEHALGFVGRGGVWIDTLADMDTLLDGIDMRAVTINQIGSSIPIFAMILTVAGARGIPIGELRGTIQNWVTPGGEGEARRGNGSVDILEFCTRHMPHWNNSSISVRNTRDQGCTAPQEVAFGCFQGAYTLRAALGRGLDLNQVASRLSFFLSAENDFLEEVAKYRAMRRLWARLVRDRLGATDPRAWTCRFHVQTSAINLTRQQPLNNIIRSSLHALAAALGGAQSMSVNSFDEVLSIPTAAAATLSLRTQQIIACESGVTKVMDPLGGSFCIEALTAEVEAAARALLERFEALPDREAFDAMDEMTQEEAFRRQQAIDRGEMKVVGVNCFTDGPEEDAAGQPQIEALRYDPGHRDKQIRRLRETRARRDPRRAEAAGRRLAEAYRAKENIVPPMIEAVGAYLSIGEISRIREEALGEPFVPTTWNFGR